MPRGLDPLKTFRGHPTLGLPEASKKVTSKDAFNCKWGETPVWAMRKKQCYWPYLRTRGREIPGNQRPANFTGNPACFHLFALSPVYPIYPQSGSPQGGKVSCTACTSRQAERGPDRFGPPTQHCELRQPPWGSQLSGGRVRRACVFWSVGGSRAVKGGGQT